MDFGWDYFIQCDRCGDWYCGFDSPDECTCATFADGNVTTKHTCVVSSRSDCTACMRFEIELWDLINGYASSVGGNPSRYVYGNVTRMKMVAAVNRLIQAALFKREAETERLTFTLHCQKAHPDFEYATTQTTRKSSDDARVGLEGDGWEPNDIVDNHEYKDGKVVKEYWRNWERFQFHENNYWRRRRKTL